MADGATGGAIVFSLNGHEYTTTLIPAEEGISILARLIAMLGEPLAGLAEKVLADPTKIAALLGAMRDKDDKTPATALIAGISLSSLGRDLRNGLVHVEAAPLIRDLVKWTHRDGKPLRDTAEFNAAFRGNYAELFSLVWRLIQENRLFPVPGT